MATKKRRGAPFRLHVNYFGEPRRRVWTVRMYGRNHYLTHVNVFVPVFTTFRGQTAAEPRAFLFGRGVLRIIRFADGSKRYGEITKR